MADEVARDRVEPAEFVPPRDNRLVEPGITPGSVDRGSREVHVPELVAKRPEGCTRRAVVLHPAPPSGQEDRELRHRKRAEHLLEPRDVLADPPDGLVRPVRVLIREHVHLDARHLKLLGAKLGGRDRGEKDIRAGNRRWGLDRPHLNPVGSRLARHLARADGQVTLPRMDAEMDDVRRQLVRRGHRRPERLRLVVRALRVVEVREEPARVVWRCALRDRPADLERVLACAHVAADLVARFGVPTGAEVANVCVAQRLAVEHHAPKLRLPRAANGVEVKERPGLAGPHLERQLGLALDQRPVWPEVVSDLDLGEIHPKRLREPVGEGLRLSGRRCGKAAEESAHKRRDQPSALGSSYPHAHNRRRENIHEMFPAGRPAVG